MHNVIFQTGTAMKYTPRPAAAPCDLKGAALIGRLLQGSSAFESLMYFDIQLLADLVNFNAAII
jgi:hypothetical protein